MWCSVSECVRNEAVFLSSCWYEHWTSYENLHCSKTCDKYLCFHSPGNLLDLGRMTQQNRTVTPLQAGAKIQTHKLSFGTYLFCYKQNWSTEGRAGPRYNYVENNFVSTFVQLINIRKTEIYVFKLFFSKFGKCWAYLWKKSNFTI